MQSRDAPCRINLGECVGMSCVYKSCRAGTRRVERTMVYREEPESRMYVCMYILKSLAMYIKIHDVCIVKSPKRLVTEETEIVVKRRLNVPYVYILKKG